VFSAKGAAFNLKPGATPHGLGKKISLALKARFTSASASIIIG